MVAKKQMIGLKFNRLLVLADVERRNDKIIYECLCDCGNITRTYGNQLRNNKTKSCGCLQQEQLSSGSKNRQHSMYGTQFYNTWRAMIRRCTDENFISYKDYGAKGISINLTWLKFEAFYSDMFPTYIDGYTIERKDNSKNYNLDNCTWIPREEQPRHASSNKLSYELARQIIDLNSYGFTVAELVVEYNCSDTTIRNCINKTTWA